MKMNIVKQVNISTTIDSADMGIAFADAAQEEQADFIVAAVKEFNSVTALDVDDYQGGRVEVCTSGGTKLIISHPDRLIDITAIKEEARKQRFFNSLKALSVKPNDTIVASMIPQQISLTETRKLFDTVKAIWYNYL